MSVQPPLWTYKIFRSSRFNNLTFPTLSSFEKLAYRVLLDKNVLIFFLIPFLRSEGGIMTVIGMSHTHVMKAALPYMDMCKCTGQLNT